MPLSTWFWAAFLVSSQTPGMSAVQLQRQLGLTRIETAFQILHKLRAGIAPSSGRIGQRVHVEVDETSIGGVTKGKGRGVHEQVCVAGAVEVKQKQPSRAWDYGRIRFFYERLQAGDMLKATLESSTHDLRLGARLLQSCACSSTGHHRPARRPPLCDGAWPTSWRS